MRNLDIDVIFTEICTIKERERSRRKVGDFYIKMVKRLTKLITLVASQKKTMSELVLCFSMPSKGQLYNYPFLFPT